MNDLTKNPNSVVKRHVTPKNADLIVADLSSSMVHIAFGGKSRYECLCLAVKDFTGRASVLAFNNRVFEVECNDLPHPSGSTKLHLALHRAVELTPLHVLVISDGVPDNQEWALGETALLAEQCVVDALYVGPANEVYAEKFMRELARIGHGRYAAFNMEEHTPKMLEQKVGAMLSLPAPTTVEL
jgi:hypothetical protein